MFVLVRYTWCKYHNNERCQPWMSCLIFILTHLIFFQKALDLAKRNPGSMIISAMMATITVVATGIMVIVAATIITTFTVLSVNV